MAFALGKPDADKQRQKAGGPLSAWHRAIQEVRLKRLIA
jgi:hypothetical protein